MSVTTTAFLVGFSIATVIGLFGVVLLLHWLWQPWNHLPLLAWLFGHMSKHFPPLVVTDLQGEERLVQLSALRDSLLRISRQRRSPTGFADFDT